MKKIIVLSFLLLCCKELSAALIISEIASGTAGADWVEIKYQDSAQSSINIATYFVTMYYGTNEPLAAEPVTLYSWDRPETPYDDRFAVVHLADPVSKDETDFTGDTNRNGRIDIYCNNYSGSLWNSECVVSIDTNDDPSDGMIDFAVWSDNDGDPSSVIAGYVEAAVRAGQWTGSASYVQSCAVAVAKDGIESYQSISRIGAADTNAAADFSVTSFQTPGMENIFSGPSGSGQLFSVEKKKVTAVPDNPLYPARFSMIINEQCDIRLRVFSDRGQLLWDSGKLDSIAPGYFYADWPCRAAHTGLYIGEIEGSCAGLRKSRSEKIFFIVTRYR